jgi:hypothetical protein
MAISIEYFVRREAARLLRASFPGLFFCLSCLARLLRSALGTAYTKGQIEGALQTVSQTPGSLTYKRASACGQCGKTAPCFGEGPRRS